MLDSFAALGFGLLSAVGDLRSHSVPYYLLDAVIRGAVWGLLTVPLVLGLLLRRDRKARRDLRLPEKGRWDAVEAERTIDLDAPFAQAYQRAVHAVRSLPKCHVIGADPSTHRIEAKIGMTKKSWRERVSVSLEPTDADSTRLVIRSVPAFRLTIADYGKNGSNVQHIAERLDPSLRGGSVL